MYPKWDIINLFFYMGQITNQTKTSFSWLQSYGLAFTLFFYASHALAQNTKIDFDKFHANPSVQASYTSDGYTSWVINNIATSVSKTFDTGVTLKISHGRNTTSTNISNNGNSGGIGSTKTAESNLVSDGITSYISGNTKNQSGCVSIIVTISGLTIGNHSVQAYHNYVEASELDNAIVPPIQVKVGNYTSNLITQTLRKSTLSESARSFVSFNVTSTNQEIEIEYYSVPQENVSYTGTHSTTQFFINSLEIDPVAATDYQAQNPYPQNTDIHANVDNSNITLSWTAASGATKHIVYFGDNEDQVNNASSGGFETELTSLIRNGLSPLQTYYWRVDEVINDVTYKGIVWSFRPRRLAFPGAEGAGKYAIGGRGGDVYHVTNLNDSGEGSLRYGIENATGPRTIVFDVSGVIQLQTDLTCNKPYITIAGQTAPGKGIMIRDRNYGSSGDDQITRFMRFRYGHGDDWDGTTINPNVSNAAGLKGNHSIMDHCLLGWGSDETLSTRDAGNISFQHSIIGESLNKNGHENKNDPNDLSVEHGYAASIGGEVGSFHHNLLAHNEGRNWSLAGGLLDRLEGGKEFKGEMNIYNNVVYNWRNRGTDGGAKEVNFVGNYYKKGPAFYQKIIFSADHEDDFAGHQQYYLSENLRVDRNGTNKIYDIKRNGTTRIVDNENEVYRKTISPDIINNPINYETFLDEPFSFYSMDVNNVESAEAAYKNVLSDVGCNYEELDINEKRLITETLNGTYSKTGSRTGEPGLIDKESDSEGWTALAQDIISESRPADWDTDRDGIPDWFETAKGWSNVNLNNNHIDGASTGWYTDLEIYLNWMACPHFIDLEVGIEKIIDLATYFAGYTNPDYTIVTSDIDVSISNNKLVVNPTTSGLFSVQVKATESSISLTRTFNIYVKPAEEQDENEYNEVTTSEIDTPFSITGNIFWPLNTGGADQTALVVFGDDDVNDLFTVKPITLGNKIEFAGLDNHEKMTKFLLTSNESDANDNNRIQFYVSLEEGYTFTPTSISVTASKYGTNGGKFDISWYSNGFSIKDNRYIGLQPARAASGGVYNDPASTTYTWYLSDQESVTGLFGVKLNVYGNISNKQYWFKDIIINGTISGTKTTNQTKIILKETANDHFPYKKGKTTVFTDESLPINYANVTLQRTLSNSFWNSFCVPFNISQEQINEVFGGGEVLEFSNATRSSVTFKTVTTGIRAGVPCLFKPINSVTNPDFSQVNITESEEEIVEENGFRFEGHFARYDMATDQSEYFLSTDGKLYYPNPNQNHLLGMRATFTIPPTIARQGIIRMIIDEDMVSEGLDVVDGLQSVDGGFMLSQPVYNLNGQKVGMTNSKLDKGVYIVNGKKVIIQ